MLIGKFRNLAGSDTQILFRMEIWDLCPRYGSMSRLFRQISGSAIVVGIHIILNGFSKLKSIYWIEIIKIYKKKGSEFIYSAVHTLNYTWYNYCTPPPSCLLGDMYHMLDSLPKVPSGPYSGWHHLWTTIKVEIFMQIPSQKWMKFVGNQISVLYYYWENEWFKMKWYICVIWDILSWVSVLER